MKERIQKRDWPEFLSEEFKLYLDGAAEFSVHKWDEAAAKFEQLLALPLEERRYRSTWAAYMRARVELKKGDLNLKNTSGVPAKLPTIGRVSFWVSREFYTWRMTAMKRRWSRS
jgi:hypothetical protein